MAAKAGWHRNYVTVSLCIATVKRRERGCGTADLEYFEAVSDVVVVDVDVERLVVVEAAVVAVDVLTDQSLLGVHADEVHLHIDTHAHTRLHAINQLHPHSFTHSVYSTALTFWRNSLPGFRPFLSPLTLSLPLEVGPIAPIAAKKLRSRPHCPHCG